MGVYSGCFYTADYGGVSMKPTASRTFGFEYGMTPMLNYKECPRGFVLWNDQNVPFPCYGS